MEQKRKRIKLVIFAVFILLLYSAANYFAYDLLEISLCPMYEFFGVPCPLCGMSRAAVLFLQLRFEDAFLMHPLLLLAVAIAAVSALAYIIKNKNLFENKKFMIVAAAIFTAVYILKMATLYPNVEPMIYNHSSVLGFVIKLFK
jgi:phosphatidylserine synthase